MTCETKGEKKYKIAEGSAQEFLYETLLQSYPLDVIMQVKLRK